MRSCDKEEVENYLKFLEITVSIIKELAEEGMDEKKVAEFGGFPDLYSASSRDKTYISC